MKYNGYFFKIKIKQPAFENALSKYKKRIEGIEEKKSIGILNKGKNNKFIDSSFVVLDVGIQDEGEGTYASGNKFLNKTLEKNENNKKREWFSMQNPLVWLIFTVLGGLLIYCLSNFF